MNASKRFMITAAFVLIAGLAVSMAAQRKTDAQVKIILPPAPVETTVTLTVNAIEISDGAVGVDENFGQTLFGYSFLGRTAGELSGSFMVSMNCAPAFFAPAQTNMITGGVWALPVYTLDSGLSNYAGSLHGTIVDGKMGGGKVGNGTVVMNLNVDGGTETWNGAKGAGVFEGTLITDLNGMVTLDGTLTITYTGVVN